MHVRSIALTCVIMHFNGRNLGGQIRHTTGSPCKKKEKKSRINMECEVFMLQLAADGSIPKNASGPRERLFAITIHYYSIRIHRGTLVSIQGEPCSTCRLVPATEPTVNVVRPSMQKRPPSPSTVLIF